MPALEARGIVKSFPGIVANDHVDFDLRRGEIHALLGENGAGKSTLVNILAGLYLPDAGDIRLDGQPVAFDSPKDAIAAGLGMVHQHFTLVPSQTVTENVLLGMPEPRFWLHPGRSEAEIGELAERFGLRVHPAAKIWQLSVGEQQRVEVLKLLYRGARILIMDEPTAVLAPQEIDDLFRDAPVDGRGRSEHRLHQPQARRGHGHRRPDHRHAPWQGDRGWDHAGRDVDDGPRPADGRSRGPRGRRQGAPAGRRGHPLDA